MLESTANGSCNVRSVRHDAPPCVFPLDLLHTNVLISGRALCFLPTLSLSLHVALQLNWILVAALEDYHAEMPDGSKNKKANTVYFNRCAKLLQVYM